LVEDQPSADVPFIGKIILQLQTLKRAILPGQAINSRYKGEGEKANPELMKFKYHRGNSEYL
jgi:hypothetical protein